MSMGGSFGPNQEISQDGTLSEIMQNPYTTAVTQAAQEEIMRDTLENRRKFYTLSIIDKTRTHQQRCSRIGVSEMHREDRKQLAEGLADLVKGKSSQSNNGPNYSEEKATDELLPPSFRPMRREGTKSFLERQKMIARVRVSISMKERKISHLQAQLAQREEKIEADELSLNRLEMSLETSVRAADTGAVETTRQAELAAHKLEVCKRRLDELETTLQTIFREVDRQADLLELNLTARQFLEEVAAESILRGRVQEIQAERNVAEQNLKTIIEQTYAQYTASKSTNSNSATDPYELLKTKEVLKASLEFCTFRASLLSAAGLDCSHITERGMDTSHASFRRKLPDESRRYFQVDFDFGEFQTALGEGLPADLFRYTPPLIEDLQREHLESIRSALDTCDISLRSVQRVSSAKLPSETRVEDEAEAEVEIESDAKIEKQLEESVISVKPDDTEDRKQTEDESYLRNVRIFETLPVENVHTDPSVRRAILLLRRSCTDANVPFDDASELMGAMKRLEDANLLRAEQLQDYSSIVANVQADNAIHAADFASQQAALRANISNMEGTIAELRRTLATEMANSTEAEVDRLESELGYLHQAVSLAGMRTGAIGSDDVNMASHSILGAMELLLDRTLVALAQIPVEKFQESRRKLNKLRRDISKNAKQAEQDRLQAERNAKIALRTERTSQVRAPGRTVQFRSYGGQEKRLTCAQRELAARLSREDKVTGENKDFYSRDI